MLWNVSFFQFLVAAPQKNRLKTMGGIFGKQTNEKNKIKHEKSLNVRLDCAQTVMESQMSWTYYIKTSHCPLLMLLVIVRQTNKTITLKWLIETFLSHHSFFSPTGHFRFKRFNIAKWIWLEGGCAARGRKQPTQSSHRCPLVLFKDLF